MSHAPCAAVLFAAAALCAGEGCDAGDLTTEQLHAASPLARALNARVHPPAPRSSFGRVGRSAGAAPAELAGPAWLKLLTPRSALGQVTQVAAEELSSAEIALQGTYGLRGTPPFVTVTPAFSALFLDEPNPADFPAPGPDLPSRLYGFSAGFTAFMPISEQWTIQASLSPGLFTDLDNTSSDAFRTPGNLLGIYTLSPRTQFTIGVAYLDREDISFLPAVGVIHRPNARTTYELILPRPRVVRQLWGCDATDGAFGYVVGELGGGSWAVRRDDRPGVPTDDVATLSDLRLLAGFEMKNEGALGFLAESGLVFGREVQYASGVGDTEFDSAFLLRLGLRR